MTQSLTPNLDRKTLHKNLVDFFSKEETLSKLTSTNPSIAKETLKGVQYTINNTDDYRSWINLIQCKPSNILNEVCKLAVLNIPVDPLKGTGFLTSRYSKRGDTHTCVGLPGVRGYERVLFETQKIGDLRGGVFRKQDTVKVTEGSNTKVTIERNILAPADDSNPIVGAFSTIVHKDGREHSHYCRITEKQRNDGSQKKDYILDDGSKINTSFMPIDAAGKYVAQRAASRHVIRTWLQDNSNLQSLVDMEDTAWKKGEEIAGTMPQLTKNKRSRELTSVEVETPSEGEQPAEAAPVPDSTGESPANVNDLDPTAPTTAEQPKIQFSWS